jgi:hypothetical protein
LLAIILVVLRPKKFAKKELIFFIVIFLGCAFLISDLSFFFWKRAVIPYLMPWRLLTITSIASAALTAMIIASFKKSYHLLIIPILLIPAVMFLSRHYLKPTIFPISFVNAYDQFPTATTEEEFNPVGMDRKILSEKREEVRLLYGEGEIKNIFKKAGLMTFSAQIKNESLIQANVLYFPGWQVKIDNKEIFPNTRIPSPLNNARNGLISFWLSSGNHQVKIYYTETPLRKFADIISLFAILITIILLVWSKFGQKTI